MTKKLRKTMRTTSHQKQNTEWKTEITKKEPQMKILESEITIMEMKNISREFNTRFEQEE